MIRNDQALIRHLQELQNEKLPPIIVTNETVKDVVKETKTVFDKLKSFLKGEVA